MPTSRSTGSLPSKVRSTARPGDLASLATSVVSMNLLSISQHASVKLSEVGFLLFVIAGVWLVAAEVLPPKWARFRIGVSGGLIAAGGVVLIIAAHYGTLV